MADCSIPESLFGVYKGGRKKLSHSTRKPKRVAIVCKFQADDPYRAGQKEGDSGHVRRIEGRFFLTSSFLKQFIPWLQQKLEELEKKDA